MDDGQAEEDLPQGHRNDPRAPWPVRRGGIVLWLYSHSLGTAVFLLFAVCMALHAVGSARKVSEEAARHGPFTADSSSKAALAFTAIRRASVVLPVPGGP